jgi:hypothetical protein
MFNQTKSVLLNTSAGTDVQYVGGELTIPGFVEPIKQTRIIDISQINYRAEVSQVVTIGATAYTPTASTRYIVTINDPNRRDMGQGEQPFVYSYTTPVDITTLGANAALQREAIHLALIAKINAKVGNWCSAATLTGGAGFTITDDAGYYPYPRQGSNNRQGANTIALRTDDDGRGFAVTNKVLTTAAVYSVGVGATLANFAPVIDYMTGNVISGDLVEAPKTVSGTYAVSGQKYNCFNITYKADCALPTIDSRYNGIVIRNVAVWVDNGAGTATTNLAGYIAFERQLHRGLFNKYSQDPSAQVDFLDNVILGAAGAVPTATGANKMVSDAKWIYTQIGSQTLTTPTPGNDGLILDQDLADTEGAEYTPSLLTSAPQEFVVGKSEFSVFARIKAGDWTDAAFLVGFRKKAAHAADFNDYTDLAAVGSLAANGDLITTQGILNNAATVSTSTAIVPVDATYLTVEVQVAISGLVTCKLNDIAYPVYSTGTTALIFDAGDIMIPFVRYANISTGDPDLVLNEVAAVPAIWKR